MLKKRNVKNFEQIQNNDLLEFYKDIFFEQHNERKEKMQKDVLGTAKQKQRKNEKQKILSFFFVYTKAKGL